MWWFRRLIERLERIETKIDKLLSSRPRRLIIKLGSPREQ